MIALVVGLPDDSAIIRQESPWTFRDELAVIAVEQAGEWGRAISLLLAGKKATLPPQLSFTRPGSPEPRKKVTWDEGEIRRFFAGL